LGGVLVWVDANDDTTREEVWEYLQGEFLPELLAGTSASLVGAFTPLPLQVDAPGVAKQDENTTRTLLLFFLDQEPTAEWSELFEEGLAKLDASGKATAEAGTPTVWTTFIPSRANMRATSVAPVRSSAITPNNISLILPLHRERAF